jgi:hypothetical protein
VEIIGDIDGDGTPDYLVGAPQANTNRGLVELRSGASHAVIRTHQAAGTAPDDRFGATLGRLGDVDGDGVYDYFITAPSEDPVGSSAHYVGSVRHYTGATGQAISLVMGNGGSHYCGQATPGRDIDGDGGLEILVGSTAFFTSTGGYLRLHNDTGEVLHEYVYAPPFHSATGRITADHDGDGMSDIVIWGWNGGRLDIVSTGTWSVIRSFAGSPGLEFKSDPFYGPSNLELIPDLDGDGIEDFAYGDHNVDRVYLLGSVTGLVIDEIHGPAGTPAMFGASIRYFEETGQLLIGDMWSTVEVYELRRDCDGDGTADWDEIASGTAFDCNLNGRPDACEIALGLATDFDSNGIPDDCLAPLLNTDRTQASVATGAQVQLTLRAGAASAFDVFVLLGSASGTVPGLADPVTGLVLPLNFDPYFELLYASSGAGIVAPFFGFLDANGNATATVTVPAGTNPSLVGLHLDHAYLTIDLFGTGLMGLASNPVPLELTL